MYTVVLSGDSSGWPTACLLQQHTCCIGFSVAFIMNTQAVHIQHKAAAGGRDIACCCSAVLCCCCC
jgi:hypothetical protein